MQSRLCPEHRRGPVMEQPLGGCGRSADSRRVLAAVVPRHQCCRDHWHSVVSFRILGRYVPGRLCTFVKKKKKIGDGKTKEVGAT